MISETREMDMPVPTDTPSAPPIPLWRYLLVVALLLACVPLVRMAASEQVDEGIYGKVGLSGLPRQYDAWAAKEEDVILDKVSLDELVPDDYLSRQYTAPDGMFVDVLVVYGHLKKTFHSPGFCLPGGGYQIDSKSVVREGLPLPMNLFRMSMEKEGTRYRLLVLYTFVQGEKGSPSLLGHNWNILKSRLAHMPATGALVRYIIPVYPNEEVTLIRAKDFINRSFPDVLKRINSVPVPEKMAR